MRINYSSKYDVVYEITFFLRNNICIFYLMPNKEIKMKISMYLLKK